MSARMTIAGLAEIERAFRELPKTPAKKVVRQGVRAGAKVIHAGVVSSTPSDSGRLKKSFKVRAARARSRNVIAVGVASGAGQFPPPKGYYGAAHEFGTSEQPGQHSAARGFDAKASEAVKVVETTIAEGIVREAAKLA
jgi:HK97 gp10 family phage protein